MPQTDAADRAASISALKQASWLIASHARPSRATDATLHFIAQEIVAIGGGQIIICTRCSRPIVVDGVARDPALCHKCRKAVKRATILATRRRPLTAK